MAPQLDRSTLAAVAKKLGALECLAGFDETVLLFPETEGWAAIISNLCDRLRCGCTSDKQLPRAFSTEELPPGNVERTQSLLSALHIEATEQQILGSGSVADRLSFIHRLSDIALATEEMPRGERLKTAVSKDAQLLSTVCRAVPDLLAGEVNLFKRFPEIQPLLQSDKYFELDGTSMVQKLRDANAAFDQAHAELQALGGKHEAIDAEQLREACASLEHSIGAFVSGSVEFQALYKQEFELWTQPAGNCTGTCTGIGPLAKRIDASYASFRQVLQACTVLRASYEALAERHAAANADNSYMPLLLSKGPAMARELQDRASALHKMHTAGVLSGAAATATL